MAALLESGGTVLLSGQNALEGDPASSFGQEYLGAVVRSTSVGSRSVEGVPGTSFEGISFAIEGGTGANNQVSPDALDPVGQAFRPLGYASGEGAAVAKVGSGTRRSLACGFGLEACADAATLGETMDFFFRWLDGSVPVDETPPPRLAVRCAPNPSEGIVSIHGLIPEGTPTSLRIVDLAGRTVRVVFEGPWEPRPLSCPGLPRGAYVVIAFTPYGSASHPLVVLEALR